MNTIEGLTPDMLWNFGYTMLGIIAIIIVLEKIPDLIWKWRDRKQKSQEGPRADFAEDISKKIIENLEPRFNEINEKLRNDKARLDSHEYALSGMHKAQVDISEGFSVLCYAMIAVLNHGIHNGNKDEMEQALNRLHDYLSRRNNVDHSNIIP